MRRHLRFLVLALAVSVCLGRSAVPLVAGTATAFENRKDVAHVTLTTDQLNTLSRWLEKRLRQDDELAELGQLLFPPRSS